MSSPTLSHPHIFHHTSPLLSPPYTSCPLLIPPPLSLHILPSPYTSSPLLTPPPLSLHLLKSPYTSSLSLHLLPSPYTSSPLLTPPPLSLHLLPSPYTSSPLLTRPISKPLSQPLPLHIVVTVYRTPAGGHTWCQESEDRCPLEVWKQSTRRRGTRQITGNPWRYTHLLQPLPFLLCALEIIHAVSIPKCIFNVHDQLKHYIRQSNSLH